MLDVILGTWCTLWRKENVAPLRVYILVGMGDIDNKQRHNVYNMLEGGKYYRKEYSLTVLYCAFIVLIINI